MRFAVLVVTMAALLMGMAGGVALAQAHPYPWNGVFVEHGYMCVSKTDAQIQEVVQWCINRDIKYQFLNVAALDSNGNLPPSQYSQLARYLQVAKAYDPTQKYIVYVSGKLTDHVNAPAKHQTIADTMAMLYTNFDIDGINLDFEPFQPDHDNYISLFSKIRQAVGPNAYLSLDVTAYTYWSGPFVNQVSSYFDLLAPMFYDSERKTVAAYQAWVIEGFHHYSSNMAPNCQVYPLIAAYKKNRWHDPNIENICTGTDALMQAVSEGASMYSLGVWWRYDWSSADDVRWQDCWINREFVDPPQNPPVANFSGNPTSGTAPLTVNFTDLSTNNPTSWSWTFGDGGNSTAQHPSRQYTSVGQYTVSLTATNAYGSDTETKTNYITVSAPPQDPPVANFSGSPTSGTAPLTVNFTDLSTNSPTSWSWTFGDGGTSTAQNPSRQYASAGQYTVSLTATNAHGSDTETKTNYITVSDPGSGQDYVCSSATVAVGTLQSGSYVSTHASDDVYLVVRSVRDSGKQYVVVNYTFNVGLSSLSSLSFTVEGKVSDGTQLQRIYLRDTNGKWRQEASSTLTTSDTTVFQEVSNPNNWIQNGVVQLQVKVGGSGTTVFDHLTDLVKITAAP